VSDGNWSWSIILQSSMDFPSPQQLPEPTTPSASLSRKGKGEVGANFLGSVLLDKGIA